VLFGVKSALSLVVNTTSNTTTQILELIKPYDERQANKSLLKIAFGSCYGMLHFMTDIFKTINQYEPNLWIWLGDAAYTDDIGKAVCKQVTFSFVSYR